MSKSSPVLPKQVSLAFLLSQIGFHSAAGFGRRLAPHHLLPAHAGILRIIEQERGISQQKLARILGIFPSRLVLVLDDLEHMGLIHRTVSTQDRRRCALQMTKKGQETLRVIWRVGQEHQKHLCAALNVRQQATLVQLLSKMARQQGLAEGIHPGFRQSKHLTGMLKLMEDKRQ